MLKNIVEAPETLSFGPPGVILSLLVYFKRRIRPHRKYIHGFFPQLVIARLCSRHTKPSADGMEYGPCYRGDSAG